MAAAKTEGETAKPRRKRAKKSTAAKRAKSRLFAKRHYEKYKGANSAVRELEAMQSIANTLLHLPEAVQQRVIGWVTQRFA